MLEMTDVGKSERPFGHDTELFYRAETDWHRRTKRSDFVLAVRLSVTQGLA
jgi:hypothetical protein